MLASPAVQVLSDVGDNGTSEIVLTTKDCYIVAACTGGVSKLGTMRNGDGDILVQFRHASGVVFNKLNGTALFAKGGVTVQSSTTGALNYFLVYISNRV